MGNYSDNPTGTPFEYEKCKELYILTKHWKSDLEFYKNDLRFLHNLVDKYLIWITKKENLELVNTIRKKEFDLGLQCDNLLEEIKKHLNEGALIIKNSKGSNLENFKNNHLSLENNIAQFIKEFRENRKEVFKVTEYIMDTEDLGRILNN
jgi:hypothetical protein